MRKYIIIIMRRRTRSQALEQDFSALQMETHIVILLCNITHHNYIILLIIILLHHITYHNTRADPDHRPPASGIGLTRRRTGPESFKRLAGGSQGTGPGVAAARRRPTLTRDGGRGLPWQVQAFPQSFGRLKLSL